MGCTMSARDRRHAVMRSNLAPCCVCRGADVHGQQGAALRRAASAGHLAICTLLVREVHGSWQVLSCMACCGVGRPHEAQPMIN